jgi:hypothetical protein
MMVDFPITPAEFAARQADFKRTFTDQDTECKFYMSVLHRVNHKQELYFGANPSLLYMDMIQITQMPGPWIAIINAITSHFFNYFNVYPDLQKHLIESLPLDGLDQLNLLINDSTVAQIAPRLLYDTICKLAINTRYSAFTRSVLEDQAINIIKNTANDKKYKVPYEMHRLAIVAYELQAIESHIALVEINTRPTWSTIHAELQSLRSLVDMHLYSKVDQIIDHLEKLRDNFHC